MYQFGRDLVSTRTYPPIYTQIHKNKPKNFDDTPKNIDDTSTFPEEWQDTQEWDDTSATEQLDTFDEYTTTNASLHTSPHTLEQMKKWIKLMFIEHPEDEQIDSLSRGIKKYENNDIIHLKRLLKGMPVVCNGKRATIESLEKDGIVVLWILEPEKIQRLHFNEIEF